MAIYRGFSTLVNAKKYSLTDYQLARQDLINYFNIRRGEKLMQPSFGTIIWDMLFEPLTEDSQQLITSDINKIISYDPRFSVGQVAITEPESSGPPTPSAPAASAVRATLNFVDIIGAF